MGGHFVALRCVMSTAAALFLRINETSMSVVIYEADWALIGLYVYLWRLIR